MPEQSIPTKAWYKRPWIWVVLAAATALVLYNFNKFPAGRYECTWSGSAPSGELAGDLVVTVGTWPTTYPLKARIYTATGPVLATGWSHVHRDFEKELHAVIPIGSTDYQALCEMQ